MWSLNSTPRALALGRVALALAILGSAAIAVAPFVDPAAPDPATLLGALRLARLLALMTLRDAAAEIDAETIRTALAGVRAELEALKGIKATLTSISSSATGLQATLDRLRDAVIARVVEAEAEIRLARARP